jgi:enoyl-CoA hydratase/carnithine racemase
MLADYAERFACAVLSRDEGILEIRLSHDGGPFVWGMQPHSELPVLWREVGDDIENRVVILTGTGDTFTGPEAVPATRSVKTSLEPAHWYRIMREARQLIMNELDIDVPMIAAVNGPAYRHMELALMCDIVVASDDAVFEDAAHVPAGNLAPGDGMNLLLAELMGVNRARYLHLTGQRLTAVQAREVGLVSEVVPKAEVLPRAWELARALAAKPDLLLRHSRLLMVQRLKRVMLEGLSEHLLYEGLAQLDSSDPARTAD